MNTPRLRRSTLAIAGVVAALSLTAVACGSKKTVETTTTAAPTTEAPTTEAPTTAAAAQTIVDIAAGNADFSILVEAVQAAGLVETLKGKGPFTVFAPTDEAFAKIPKAQLDALLKDKKALAAVLTYHVVAGKVLAADVVKLKEAKTVNGAAAKIMVDRKSVV